MQRMFRKIRYWPRARGHLIMFESSYCKTFTSMGHIFWNVFIKFVCVFTFPSPYICMSSCLHPLAHYLRSFCSAWLHITACWSLNVCERASVCLSASPCSGPLIDPLGSAAWQANGSRVVQVSAEMCVCQAVAMLLASANSFIIRK